MLHLQLTKELICSIITSSSVILPLIAQKPITQTAEFFMNTIKVCKDKKL